MSRPHRRAEFLDAARADVRRLAQDDPDLAQLALRKVRDLENGAIDGQPLSEMAKAGDLSDCYKLYFGPGRPPSHRIVYREAPGPDATIEILEIVAVEARNEMYAYLLAATRLGRLPDETKPHFNRVHQQVIQERARRQR